MKRQAVTLVELLIAASISTIVAGLIAAIFVSSWKAHITQEAYSELQQKGRLATDEIASAVKLSSGVVASITSNNITYTSSASSIVLKTPAISSDNTILAATDYFVFRLNPSTPTNLERIIIADPTSDRVNLAASVVLNDRAASLTIAYLNSAGATLTIGVDDLTVAGSVNYVIDSQKVAQGRTINRAFDNRVYLRNKP